MPYGEMCVSGKLHSGIRYIVLLVMNSVFMSEVYIK